MQLGENKSERNLENALDETRVLNSFGWHLSFKVNAFLELLFILKNSVMKMNENSFVYLDFPLSPKHSFKALSAFICKPSYLYTCKCW